jgi:hypothetical protein
MYDVSCRIVACVAHHVDRNSCQYPETAKFLSEGDREIVISMLKEDRHGLSTNFRTKFIWQALTDKRTYYQTGIYMGLLIPVYAISLFTPTIVRDLGFSAANAQLLMVPPFFCGCIATIISESPGVLQASLLLN